MNSSEIENILNETYPGIGMFARDVNLASTLEDKYRPGMILYERGFCDATHRIGAATTSHRFLILSNRMLDGSQFESGTNWGLHIANRGSRFKVISVFKEVGLCVIVLLHLPEKGWEIFSESKISVDDQLVDKCLEKIVQVRSMGQLQEVTTDEWLDRCKFPIGMDDDGVLFED